MINTKNENLSFDAVIILSDSVWDKFLSAEQQFYTRVFSSQVPVFFVQKFIKDKTTWTEYSENNLTIINPIRGHSIESVLEVIKRAKNEHKSKKILFWLYTSLYSEYLNNIIFPTIIVTHLIGNDINDINKIKEATKLSSFLIVDSKEAAKIIQDETDVSSNVFFLIDKIDYNIRNTEVEQLIFGKLNSLIIKQKTNCNLDYLRAQKKRILFLYNVASCRVNTVREYVNAFGLFSRHEVTYFDAIGESSINESFLNSFDVIVIHYSVRISSKGHLSEDIHQKLKKYNGVKFLFIQDEYDNLAMTYSYMKSINFDTVFSCVPNEFLDYVYPGIQFGHTNFINILTGYIPYTLLNFKFPKIADRNIDVFYRGRSLPYIYGTLGREKYEIGFKFKKALNDLGVEFNVDIESDEEKRIYGDSWNYRLSRSKATLGTESGSNLFDFDGNLESLIEEEVKNGKGYEDIYEKYIKERESQIQMNQISPKVFEAISLGTVLILYEGKYSGILVPWVHYIPLKKDFSNIKQVVEILQNDEELQKYSDRAYNDIIVKGEYTYQSFIQNIFDKEVDHQTLILRDRLKYYLGNEWKKDKLENYFYARTEISKLRMNSSSPNILSDVYEYFYSQNYKTISWVLKDFFYQILYFTPRFFSFQIKKIWHYCVLIKRSLVARSIRLKNKILSNHTNN